MLEFKTLKYNKDTAIFIEGDLTMHWHKVRIAERMGFTNDTDYPVVNGNKYGIINDVDVELHIHALKHDDLNKLIDNILFNKETLVFSSVFLGDSEHILKYFMMYVSELKNVEDITLKNIINIGTADNLSVKLNDILIWEKIYSDDRQVKRIKRAFELFNVYCGNNRNFNKLSFMKNEIILESEYDND